jgi:RecB family exonuclease
LHIIKETSNIDDILKLISGCFSSTDSNSINLYIRGDDTLHERKFSFSNFSMNMFNNCPQKFKLKFINRSHPKLNLENRYISFDKTLHSAMAKLNYLNIHKLKDTKVLELTLNKSWINLGYQSIEEELLSKCRANQILINYAENPKDIGAESLIIDRILRMSLDNKSIISAKIDKVYRHFDSGIEIVDYKTGLTINKPLNFYNNYQLPLYLLLVHNYLGIYPRIISYYYLSYNKKFSYQVTYDDIRNSGKCLAENTLKIKSEKQFRCKPTQYCKNYCEYFETCRIKHKSSV